MTRYSRIVVHHHLLNLTKLRGQATIHHVRFHLNLGDKLLKKGPLVDTWVAQYF